MAHANAFALAFAFFSLAALRTGNDQDVTSGPFQGPKANTGTVTCSVADGKRMLTLSPDFKIPDTPAPHWQLVDASGHVFLLQRLKIKNDKVNQRIAIPDFVADVARVQIWCSFAETLLGETSFPAPVGGCKAEPVSTGTFQGPKANTGKVTFTREGSRRMLALSEEFKVPDTPAPHWQVVDSRGNAFLLQRLQVKGDKLNRTIVLPDQVGDVARVQIWCAFAETLLGEASFAEPVL